MRKRTAIAGVSLVASFVLMITAIGNAVALYTKAADNTHFNIGAGTPAPETVDYYLVGSGSFVKAGKSDWSKDGGVQMYAHSGDRAMLQNQYLTAGDIFKITGGISEWYGWGEQDNSSDKTNFRTAYYDYYDNGVWKNYDGGNGDTTSNGKHTYYVNHSSYYLWRIYLWNDKGNNGWSHEDGNGGIAHDSHPGGDGSHVYGYNNGRWVNDTYGTATNVIFSDNGDNTRRAETTFQSNGNIVVATSGYYDIYLNNDEQGKIYISPVS